MKLNYCKIEYNNIEILHHSNPNHFGRRFRRLYQLLTRLQHTVGTEALDFARLYAVGVVPVKYAEAMTSIASDIDFPVDQDARLEAIFSILNALPYSSNELTCWTKSDWLGLFGRYIPDIKRWYGAYLLLNDVIDKQLSECSNWWKDYDESAANPVEILTMLEDTRHETTIWGPLVDLTTMLKHLLPHHHAIGQHDVDKMRDMLLTAKLEQRMIVTVSNKNRQSDVGAIMFVPVNSEDTSTLLPTAAHTRSWDLSEVRDDADMFVKEWRIKEARANKAVGTLMLLEGVRQMAAVRSGLRCPLRSQKRSPNQQCCGALPGLERLWNAGRVAADKWHVPFERWELPLECIRS